MNIRQSWDPQWPRAGLEHRTGAGRGNVLADTGDQQRPDLMGTGRWLVARTAVTLPALFFRSGKPLSICTTVSYTVERYRIRINKSIKKRRI